MKKFNLTEWALGHKQIIYYFIAVIFITGIFSYKNLGRSEDPDFTIKQMIVIVSWPGATARQVEEQVTDKIEKKLQDTPGIDYIKSYSKPGESLIYLNLKDSVPEKNVRPTWLEVRNMVNDIKGDLPQGVVGPFFNDRFDDVFGCIYAITGDGYSPEEMREKGEEIRRILLGIPSVKKVSLVGVQTEKIYIEMENSKIAQLGIDPNVIIATVQGQNTMVPAGMLETTSDNVYLRVTGIFENIEDIRNVPIRSNNQTFRLGDIAKITRGYAEPADPKMYYNGQPAIGLSLSMDKGGNVLTLGKELDHTLDRIKKTLPVGLEINQIANQPKVVEHSIDEFVESLAEAILIVLLVSFLSLGARSGVVVALCIPLVIAAVFTVMSIVGVDLHKISLGALIIALGLLVDDAIICVETMVVKLEEGASRFEAACFAYSATAYPRLTGALVTCAGFIPVGFSKGSASEFTGSIFTVVTMALIISWIIAGTVTPLLGYLLIKIKPGHGSSAAAHNVHDTKFYRLFRQLLVWCLGHRKMVLSITVACFVASISLFGLIKQEFFPASTRPELIVDLTLPEGASIAATDEVAKQFAAKIADDPGIVNYAYHVGEGIPRFVLPFEPTFSKSNFAEFMIVTKDAKARTELTQKVNKLLAEEFTSVRGNTKVLQSGPPDPYPVMLRVTGYDHEKVREISRQVRDVLVDNPGVSNVSFDWDEKSKVLHLAIDQDKARLLGIDSKALALSLQSQVSGAPIAEFREKDKTVSLSFRMDSQSRNHLSDMKDLNIHIGNGRFVPLDQIATISYEGEDGLIWRRNLKPTITVQANIKPGETGNDIAQKTYEQLAEVRSNLPLGYSIDMGGPLEQSIKAAGFLLGPLPVMLIVILTLLMFQLQSVSKMVLTLLTAPLGIIGVSIGLVVTGSSMGFVVQLGILALAGIIMRNSVILIDQIEQQIAAGESLWDGIINATVIRFRPIILTAAAAILGMIPLVSSVFWGPMAVAIAGGLFGATILTLLVLPTMYAAWYKVTPDSMRKDDDEDGVVRVTNS